jgi:hypothetical protein
VTTGGGDCGNGTCNISDGENCSTCPQDCGGPCESTCGDFACDAIDGEDCSTCPGDCGVCIDCGDDVCDASETCASCAEDCGVCECEADMFEPNGSSPTATPIDLDTEYPGLSICPGDVDWLEFSLGGTTVVDLSFLQADGDLDLEIYSEDTGRYVTGSYGGDDGEQVVLSGEPPGIYWARVYGYQGAENWSYSILVTD